MRTVPRHRAPDWLTPAVGLLATPAAPTAAWTFSHLIAGGVPFWLAAVTTPAVFLAVVAAGAVPLVAVYAVESLVRDTRDPTDPPCGRALVARPHVHTARTPAR